MEEIETELFCFQDIETVVNESERRMQTNRWIRKTNDNRKVNGGRGTNNFFKDSIQVLIFHVPKYGVLFPFFFCCFLLILTVVNNVQFDQEMAAASAAAQLGVVWWGLSREETGWAERRKGAPEFPRIAEKLVKTRTGRVEGGGWNGRRNRSQGEEHHTSLQSIGRTWFERRKISGGGGGGGGDTIELNVTSGGTGRRRTHANHM